MSLYVADSNKCYHDSSEIRHILCHLIDDQILRSLRCYVGPRNASIDAIARSLESGNETTQTGHGSHDIYMY